MDVPGESQKSREVALGEAVLVMAHREVLMYFGT